MTRTDTIRVLISQCQAEAARSIHRLRSSQFARDAFWLLFFNLLAKGLAFFANAHAMRCLGPSKLGVSALVQVTAQQVALSFHGGFDVVAARRIARDHAEVRSVTSTVLTARLCVALICAVIWLVGAALFAPEGQRMAWSLGAVLLLTTASLLMFAFQGLEKLPIQNAIGAGGALLTATAYFLFFREGVFLGADLIVITAVAVLSSLVSLGAYRKIVGTWPFAHVDWSRVFSLLKESWRYWVLGVVVFLYSYFQIPLIASLLSTREAGIFRSAFMLAAAVELLFNSVNSLLLPRLVAWHRDGLDVMWRRQSKLFLLFLAVGSPVVGVLMLAAPFIYALLLGPEYAAAVPVFEILVLGRLVVFVGQIYAWGLSAARMDTAFLLSSTFGAVFSVTLNLLLLPRIGVMGAAYASLATEIVVHSFCFLALAKVVYGRRKHELLGE